MEKRAIIEPGRTPVEQSEKLPEVPQQKTAAIRDLDNDFRKRAADAANTASK